MRERWTIVTVHGIRTFGAWQERLARLVRELAPPDRDVHVLHYRYGFFLALAFWFPLTRFLAVRRFVQHLTPILLDEANHRIHLVGHSFGTYLIVHGLLRLRGAASRVHTILLAGSVVRCWFQWRRLLALDVQRIVNDCGSKDLPLLVSQLFVPGTGMAGRAGFYGVSGDRCFNRYHAFGHSDYFLERGQPNDAFLSTYWVPLLVSTAHPTPVDERRSPSIQATLTATAQYLEPVSFLSWAVPLLLVGLWVADARETRRVFAAQQLVEAGETNGLPAETAHWLGVASMLTSPSARALYLIESTQSVLPRQLGLDSMGWHTVALSSNGQHVAAARYVRKSHTTLAVFSLDGSRRDDTIRFGPPEEFGLVDVASVSNDGRFVVLRRSGRGVSGRYRVSLYDAGERRLVMDAAARPGFGVLSPSGRFLVQGDSSRRSLQLTSLRTGGPVARITPRHVIGHVAFGDGDSLIAIADSAATVSVWSTATGSTVARVDSGVLRTYHGAQSTDLLLTTDVEVSRGGDVVAAQVTLLRNGTYESYIDVIDVRRDSVVWSLTTTFNERLVTGGLTDSTVATFGLQSASLWAWPRFTELFRVSADRVADVRATARGELVVHSGPTVSRWAAQSAPRLSLTSLPLAWGRAAVVPSSVTEQVVGYRDDKPLTTADLWSNSIAEHPAAPGGIRAVVPANRRLVGLLHDVDSLDRRLCVYDFEQSRCTVDVAADMEADGDDVWFSRDAALVAYRDDFGDLSVMRTRVNSARARAPRDRGTSQPTCQDPRASSDSLSGRRRLTDASGADILGFAIASGTLIGIEQDYDHERSLLVGWTVNGGCAARRTPLRAPADIRKAILSRSGGYLAIIAADSAGMGARALLFDVRNPGSRQLEPLGNVEVPEFATEYVVSDDGIHIAYANSEDMTNLRVQILNARTGEVASSYGYFGTGASLAFGDDERLQVIAWNSNGITAFRHTWSPADVLRLACEVVRVPDAGSHLPENLRKLRIPNVRSRCGKFAQPPTNE